MSFVTRRGTEILTRLPAGPIIGAEIGVWDGRLSRFLLGSREDLTLYMIDRWAAVAPDHVYYQSTTMGRTTAEGWREIHDKAQQVVTDYPGRSMTIQAESITAATYFRDQFFDFVFIDAEHTYTGVQSDIEAWVPKVKRGGWICGHDWDHPSNPQWGVREAVEEFIRDQDLSVETGANTTWFVKLPE